MSLSCMAKISASQYPPCVTYAKLKEAANTTNNALAKAKQARPTAWRHF